MKPTVAVVQTDSGIEHAMHSALTLIGGIEDQPETVTIKVGIFDERNRNYPTVPVVQALVNCLTQAQRIWLVESDNYMGSALDRLRVWCDVFSEQIAPFSLSDDPKIQYHQVNGEFIGLSHVLFKPNWLVSIHALRRGQAGCIFKNLLGLVPDIKKDRFHDTLGPMLIDIAQAVGWIDLAIIDATYTYSGTWKEGIPLHQKRTNLLVVGRDPVAVETVGCHLINEDPLKIPALAEAKRRELGETDITRIHIVGQFPR
jgi:uncharacterized protein (DUF362 family)